VDIQVAQVLKQGSVARCASTSMYTPPPPYVSRPFDSGPSHGPIASEVFLSLRSDRFFHWGIYDLTNIEEDLHIRFWVRLREVRIYVVFVWNSFIGRVGRRDVLG
jgi:hypothetical protein